MTIYEILLGLAAVITAGMPGYLAWKQSKATHKEFGKFNEFVNLTRTSALAKGKLQGRAAERKRNRKTSL